MTVRGLVMPEDQNMSQMPSILFFSSPVIMSVRSFVLLIHL